MFGCDNIRDIRHKLDVSKATGIDGVGPALIKHLPDEVDAYLSQWFKILVGAFPTKWTMSVWTLLHKGGFGQTTGDFRTIAVQPAILNVFMRIIRTYLVQHRAARGLFSVW